MKWRNLYGSAIRSICMDMTDTPKYTEAQDKRRHELLGLNVEDNTGTNILYFSEVPYSTLEDLLWEGFLDQHDCQNYSPTVREIMEFMRCYADGQVLADGYVVSNDRSDRRISIEAITNLFTNQSDLADFATFCEGADELDDHRAWWD